jgi:uncharacterized protein YprB with RNaseH-like and TPR domain
MSPGSLSDRLRGIVRPGPQPAPDPVSVHEPPQARFDPIEQVLGGGWQAHSGSHCFIVERREPADSRHGSVRVGDLAERLTGAADHAPLLAAGAPARLPFVFFDLETTGLSGGAGTLAFLVGCGWFDDDGAFVTRQYVLARAGDERPMLQVLADRFATAGALISFNGKSFDAPLLESRFLFHRLDWLAARLPHVDILHPARRFWRAESSGGDVSSCSLLALERQVLGAVRHDDVAGYEVPARYFQFVRSGDARVLSAVLEHNRLDLLSLAGLTAQLLGLVFNGAMGASSAREALALGRVYEQAGLVAKAGPAWERALALAPMAGAARGLARDRPVVGYSVVNPELLAIRVEALRALARGARRERRYLAAAAYWQEVVDTPGCPSGAAREAAEALAIHHEHRVRDLESARGFALRTLDHSAARARNDAVRYRLARLERKLTEALMCPRLQFGE